jgi:Na+/proline symporter
MFNRQHTEEHQQHNYQSVYINATPERGGESQPVVAAVFGLLTVCMVLAAVVGGIAAIAYFATAIVQSLAGMIVALVAMLTAVIPWLVGCAALVALAAMIIRSLPQAVAEASEIRYRLAAQRQPLMLEAKDVDYSTVDLRSVRAVSPVNEQQ